MSLKSQHKLCLFTLCLTTVAALNLSASAQHPLDFRVHNHTDSTIVRLYVSDSKHGNWEEDVLNVDVLPPGNDVNINFSGPVDSCFFDLKAIFFDGTYAEKYRINLCQIGNFYINE